MPPTGVPTRRASTTHPIPLDMDRAAALLDRGIELLAQETYTAPTDRFLFMQDLAAGSERMLKLTWALATLNARGALPSARESAAAGSDLTRLADALADLYPPAFLRTEDGRWGQAYLRGGPWLRDALAILSDLTSPAARPAPWSSGAATDLPEDRWEALELKVAATLPGPGARSSFRLATPGDHWRLHAGIHAELARSFELLGYVLYRVMATGLPRTDAATWAARWERYLRVRPPGFATAWFEPDR